MEFYESTLLSLSFILFLGLIIPEMFKRLRLPFITSLIIIGAVIGPHGLAYLQTNEVIEFFGFLGFTFLMFMAGLETKLHKIRKNLKNILTLAISNSLFPFLVGVGIARFFKFDWTQAIILGTIFTSSSVAIIVPTLKSAKLLSRKEGQTMLSAVIIQDILSLILLAVIFQESNPVIKFPLPIYIAVLVISIIVLKITLPRLGKLLIKKRFLKSSEDEGQIRFIVLVLIISLLYFAIIGVHPILASFITGMFLSDVITSRVIIRKIHTLGYGLFVPIFFIISGTELNFGIFRELNFRDLIIPSIVIGLILAKFLSGYLAARKTKFSHENSTIFGLTSTIQLTTSLAATFAADTAGLLDGTIVSGIILLAITTTIFVPIILRFYPKKVTEEQLKESKKEQQEVVPVFNGNHHK